MLTNIATKQQQSYKWRDFNEAKLGLMPAWQHFIKQFGAEYLSPLTARPDDPTLLDQPQRCEVDWSKVHQTYFNPMIALKTFTILRTNFSFNPVS